MSDNNITWKEVAALLSPAGQDQLIEIIQTAQQRRGKDWLPAIQSEFPMASWIVELVCQKSADEAFRELQQTFPTWPLWIAESKIKTLHGRLLEVIETPRVGTRSVWTERR